MGNDYSDEIKWRLVGRSLDWIKKFDAAEYEGNRPMIEKLFEEKQIALAQAMDLEDEVVRQRTELTELKLENQQIKLQLSSLRKTAWTQALFSFLAVVLAGIGINIVTGEPSHWSGWVLVAAAAALELVVFVTGFREVRS